VLHLHRFGDVPLLRHQHGKKQSAVQQSVDQSQSMHFRCAAHGLLQQEGAVGAVDELPPASGKKYNRHRSQERRKKGNQTGASYNLDVHFHFFCCILVAGIQVKTIDHVFFIVNFISAGGWGRI
jgi:hypothetical protein